MELSDLIKAAEKISIERGTSNVYVCDEQGRFEPACVWHWKGFIVISSKANANEGAVDDFYFTE